MSTGSSNGPAAEGSHDSSAKGESPGIFVRGSRVVKSLRDYLLYRRGKKTSNGDSGGTQMAQDALHTITNGTSSKSGRSSDGAVDCVKSMNPGRRRRSFSALSSFAF